MVSTQMEHSSDAPGFPARAERWAWPSDGWLIFLGIVAFAFLALTPAAMDPSQAATRDAAKATVQHFQEGFNRGLEQGRQDGATP